MIVQPHGNTRLRSQAFPFQIQRSFFTVVQPSLQTLEMDILEEPADTGDVGMASNTAEDRSLARSRTQFG